MLKPEGQKEALTQNSEGKGIPRRFQGSAEVPPSAGPGEPGHGAQW